MGRQRYRSSYSSRYSRNDSNKKWIVAMVVIVALFVAVLAVAFLMYRDEIGPLPLIGGEEESGNVTGVIAATPIEAEQEGIQPVVAQPTYTPQPTSQPTAAPTVVPATQLIVAPSASPTATQASKAPAESKHTLGTSTITSVAELIKAYETSPSDANDMYLGKSLSIHYKIDSFTRTGTNVDMKFTVPQHKTNIVCQVADDNSLQNLEEGLWVVVNGTMTKFLRFGDIVLKDCTVPSPSQIAENSYWRGQYSYARSRYEGALEDFNRAIDLKPDYLEAYLQRVYVYKSMMHDGAAFYEAEKAAELFPLEAKFHLVRGEIAIYSYEETLDNQEQYCRNVDCLLEGYKKAEQEFSRAFELGRIEGLHGLGTTYMWLAWHFECHPNARNCDLSRPGSRVPLNLDIANEYYYKAIDSYTELIDAGLTSGSDLEFEWSSTVELSLRSFPSDQNTPYSPIAMGHILRSKIYENLGQIENAKQDWSIACSIDKTMSGCHRAPE